MELMIKKLKEEVQNLKQLLASGGNLSDLKLSPPSSPNGSSPTKKQKENKCSKENGLKAVNIAGKSRMWAVHQTEYIDLESTGRKILAKTL